MELFFLKLLDGALGTVKNLLMSKNKGFLSAVVGALGQFFYLMMMVKLVKVNNLTSIMLISLATFFGMYIPIFIANKMEKDKVWVYNITPDSNENGKEFADQVRENNIPVLTYKGYSRDMELVLCCKIFSESREKSKMIEEMIPEGFKYHVIETQNTIAA